MTEELEDEPGDLPRLGTGYLAGRVRAPKCAECRRYHLASLPCWKKPYVNKYVAIVLADGARCWLHWDAKCTRVATSVDHIIPRSYGGTDDLDNLRPACAHCNKARGIKKPFKTEEPTRPVGRGLSPRWRKLGLGLNSSDSSE